MVDTTKIKILLLTHDLTTREVARRLGVKEWTLSKTIRGHRKNPELVKKLARLLRIDLESIQRAA